MINSPERPKEWQINAQGLVARVKDPKKLREKAENISKSIVI